MASGRTDESSRLTHALVVAFAFAATISVVAGPAFAFLSPTTPFPDPHVPLQDRFAMVSDALDFAFWLLLLAVVLSRLQPQPRSLEVWLAGLAVAVTGYAVTQIALVAVPAWLQNLPMGDFYSTADLGVSLIGSAAMAGVSAVVAWSMIRWVRRPVGDADVGELDVVLAELVDGSEG